MAEFLSDALKGTLNGYVLLAAILCLLIAAEMAFPRGEMMGRADRARVIGFALLYIPVAVTSGMLIFRAIPALAPLIAPIAIGNALLAVIVADFLYYWMHRAQHSIPWLWRIHAVHHSIERMGAGSGFHHFLEAPLRTLLVAIPAGLIFGGRAGLIGGAIVIFHGYYVHSMTRLNFGPFAWIICDNRVHRIHHSREKRHFDKNFGVVSLLWDRLFGTAYFPKGEWPDVGLDGRDEPKSLLNYLRL